MVSLTLICFISALYEIIDGYDSDNRFLSWHRSRSIWHCQLEELRWKVWLHHNEYMFLIRLVVMVQRRIPMIGGKIPSLLRSATVNLWIIQKLLYKNITIYWYTNMAMSPTSQPMLSKLINTIDQKGISELLGEKWWHTSRQSTIQG